MDSFERAAGLEQLVSLGSDSPHLLQQQCSLSVERLDPFSALEGFLPRQLQLPGQTLFLQQAVLQSLFFLATIPVIYAILKKNSTS